MTIDEKFKQLLKTIINDGEVKHNVRRNVKKIEIASYTIRHTKEEGFPLLSCKAVPFKHIASELIWFLNGDNSKEFLNKYDNKIWDKDIQNWNGKDAGQNYGVQWRNHSGKFDQITTLIENMKKDINGSRLLVEAWNPAELHLTPLPPCHTGFQIISTKGGFELHWKQRSVDTFLGLPFNIASYFTLGLFLERVTGIEFLGVQGDLKCVHLYDNAVIPAIELMNKPNKKYAVPNLFFEVTPDLKNINPLYVEIENYHPDSFVKVEMLAPIK
jgi:thymidylate synthase